MAKIKTKNQGGQTILVATIFFVIISLLIILGIANPILRHFSNTIETSDSKKSFYVSESLQEDIVYRLLSGMDVDDTENLNIDGHTANAVISPITDGKKIETTGNVDLINRNLTTELILGDGATFNFGLQANDGGIILENSASVVGNVFANGSVTGEDNFVYGTVVSAGPDGLVSGIHATGSVYAHTIEDSWIEEDAYYFSSETISDTIVEGSEYPGSTMPATSSLPITDEQIEEWKSDAEAGGINDCGGNDAYVIQNEDAVIGPMKFECNLEIKGTNMTVSIAGAVWVEGSIFVDNSPLIKVDSSLEDKSVAVIADDPGSRATSSFIDLDNSAEFEGAEGNSHLLFVSQNNDAENGGNNPAIEVANSMNGDIISYAGHGEILINNSIDIRQATAYRIRARNSAVITYETGIASLLFDAGPSGGFSIKSWKETE